MDIIKLHQQERMLKINAMIKLINDVMKSGRDIDEQKFIAEHQLRFSSSRRTILEYLKELELNNYIVLKDGKIWTREAYNIDKSLENATNNKMP